MRYLDEATVRELLPMSAAIPVMREALRSFSAGRVHQPMRTMVPGDGGDVLAVMPAFVSFGGGRGMFGLKAIMAARHVCERAAGLG